MSDFSLTLGPVAFAGFELPSSITIGGRQRLAIHRLPGGIRVIDALGPDPADIAFSGIFTGPDAADRARLLDALRVTGASLPLAWDAFLYTVIIENFEADYRSPWSFATAAAAAISSPGATTSGTAAYVAAKSTLAATLTSLNNQVIAAQPGLQSGDISTASAAAGQLASLAAARAYAARAARNLAGAST